MTRCKLSLLRDDGVGDNARIVDVFLNGHPAFDLAQGQLKSLFQEVDTAHIVVSQGQQVLVQQNIPMVDGHVLNLRIEAAPVGLLGWFLRKKAARLVETSRKPLPSKPTATLKPDLTHQMWFGRAETADALYTLLGENPAYYSEENQDAEGTDAHVPLSEFARTQGATSYDHDFVEPAFAGAEGTLEQRFKGMSWATLWAPVVREKVAKEIWETANAVVLMNVETPKDRPARPQIRTPQDVNVDGVTLTYVGEITHPDYA